MSLAVFDTRFAIRRVKSLCRLAVRTDFCGFIFKCIMHAGLMYSNPRLTWLVLFIQWKRMEYTTREKASTEVQSVSQTTKEQATTKGLFYRWKETNLTIFNCDLWCISYQYCECYSLLSNPFGYIYISKRIVNICLCECIPL